MDINDLGSIVTVLSFAAFIGIVWWAYSGRRKEAYDEAARSLLDDDDKPVDRYPWHRPNETLKGLRKEFKITSDFVSGFWNIW